MADEGSVTTWLRAPRALVERVDAWASRMPVPTTRAQAYRSLLEFALDEKDRKRK